MNYIACSAIDEMVRDQPRACIIVYRYKRRDVIGSLGVKQYGGDIARHCLYGIGARIRRHDKQSVNPATHRPDRLCSFFGTPMHIAQQQALAGAMGDKVDTANDFGKELAE